MLHAVLSSIAAQSITIRHNISIMQYKLPLLGICLLLITAAGCSKSRPDAGKIGVVVTIAPLAEFAEKIGGDKVIVSAMVPPGASPHTYEPTPNQLVDVSRAYMYVKVGSPIEFELVWLDKILSPNRDMPVVDASAGITLVSMDDHGGGYDPHTWVSPKNAKIMVENICRDLISVDAKNKEYYTNNKNTYIEELNILDNEIKRMLSGKTNRRFMVYHPAWGYFAEAYDLEQIPVEQEGKEPTAQGIKNLIDQAKANNIKVVFASPQFNTASAEVIAREIGGRMVLISTLEKNYVANIRKVAKALSEAMK